MPYVVCWDATSRKTSRSAGTVECFLVAGQTDLKRVRGVPIPERRHSLTKPEKSAAFHNIAMPRPPTTAIAGVALKMNLPADHAMYVAIRTHSPSSRLLCCSRRAPRHISNNAQPTAMSATIGPYEAKRTPLLGA